MGDCACGESDTLQVAVNKDPELVDEADKKEIAWRISFSFLSGSSTNSGSLCTTTGKVLLSPQAQSPIGMTSMLLIPPADF